MIQVNAESCNSIFDESSPFRILDLHIW